MKRLATNRIFIHHSATPGKSTTVESIRRYHTDVMGWTDVGYHYVVDIDGNCHTGRIIDAIGAHAEGANSDSIGICLIGNYDEETPPAAQLTTLMALCCNICKMYGIKPEQIHTHRSVCATSCPGDKLAAFLPSVRAFTASHIRRCPMARCH